MITTFGNEATRDIFQGADTKAARTVPVALWVAIRQILHVMDTAPKGLHTLSKVQGWRLEKLQPQQANMWSVRVNAKYRIVFRPVGNDFEVVVVTNHYK